MASYVFVPTELEATRCSRAPYRVLRSENHGGSVGLAYELAAVNDRLVVSAAAIHRGAVQISSATVEEAQRAAKDLDWRREKGKALRRLTGPEDLRYGAGMRNTERIEFVLPGPLRQRVQQLADARGLSMSSLVRSLLIDEVADYVPPPCINDVADGIAGAMRDSVATWSARGVDVADIIDDLGERVSSVLSIASTEFDQDAFREGRSR